MFRGTILLPGGSFRSGLILQAGLCVCRASWRRWQGLVFGWFRPVWSVVARGSPYCGRIAGVWVDGYRLGHMACIAVAVRGSRGVSSWLAEALPRFFCVSPGVLCEVFKIMVVLSTPHRVNIAGLAANPPAFEGVEAYPIKLSSKKKNAPQRLYEPL